MPLTEVILHCSESKLPNDVRTFLREASRRIRQFQRSASVPSFVPCDFKRTYCVLRALANANLTMGNLFCEWGSGFGVVASLAAMLDFDAIGIEIEECLVDEAQQLADDFGLPVEFVCGSFIPKGCTIHTGRRFSWLSTNEDGATGALDLQANDFNVIFAYPWPDEECVTASLFERYADLNALLLTYHGGEDFRLRRKKKDERRLLRHEAKSRRLRNGSAR